MTTSNKYLTKIAGMPNLSPITRSILGKAAIGAGVGAAAGAVAGGPGNRMSGAAKGAAGGAAIGAGVGALKAGAKVANAAKTNANLIAGGTTLMDPVKSIAKAKPAF